MNDKIKDFAEQARQHATQLYPNNHDIKLWAKAYHEKFAELIVRECCDMVDNNNHNSGDEWDKALGSVINSIKEHFGVK